VSDSSTKTGAGLNEPGGAGPRDAVMLRRAEGVALAAIAVQLAAVAVAFVVGAFTGSRGAYFEGWHLLVALLPWSIALLHQRLRRQSVEEEQDLAAVARESGRAGLFEGRESEPFSAKRRLESFERLWAPGLTLLVAVAEGAAGGLLLAKALSGLSPADEGTAAVGGAFMVGAALVTFLIGRYASGMSQSPQWRLLRAGAGAILTCSALCFLVGLGLAFSHFDVTFLETAAPFVISGVLLLLSAECVLAFLFDLYRPRVPGQARRFPYDSRLGGLLAEPANVLGTLAHTLDYQFGFRISQTWFYQFMERAIAPLLIFQIASFYLLSSAVVVGPSEQCIIERFGRPRALASPGSASEGAGYTLAEAEDGGAVVIYGPGIHLKWPWPIEKAHSYPAAAVHTFIVGEVEKQESPAFLWTQVHYVGEPFFVLVSRERISARGEGGGEAGGAPGAAAPVDIVAGSIVVNYRVRNLYDFLYKHADAEATLRSACYREVTRYASRADLMDLIGAGGEAASTWLLGHIQDQADRLELGVDVLLVGLQDLHPPVPTGADFEAVVSAQEEKEATVLRAQTYSVREKLYAQADAAVMLTEADAYRHRRMVVSEAEAKRFASQLAAYEKAPGVYVLRETAAALEEGLSGVRKYVVPAAEEGRGLTTVIDAQDSAAFDAGALDLIGR